jgi:hypothetical protein
MNSLKVELPLPPKLAEKPFYIPTKVFQSRFTDTLENPVMTQIRALDIRIPRHKPNDFSKVFQGRNFLQYRELRKDIQNFSLASAFRYGVELA